MVELKTQSRVDDWILDKEIGSGGQGTVWKVRYARDKHSPPAALKICTQRDEKARKRFAREIELLREQNHPNIVRVRHSSECEGAPFYVMELATTSLSRVVAADNAGSRLVRESGPLLLAFLREACSALAHLHGAGILHRDIKPSNVLLMLDPPDPMKVVLADLGIAARESEQGQLTATHEVVGTPGFRAPESLAGIHTAASDVYAFGKTLEYVFSRGLSVSVGPGQCSRSPMFSDDLWDRLDQILKTACAFDPMARFEDGKALLDAMPEVVVALSKPRTVTPAQAGTSLSNPEVVTLFEVLSQCPATTDWTSVDSVRSKAGLAGYQFTLSLRRLQELGFVETRLEQSPNYNTDDYTVCQPTLLGVRWAQLHQFDDAIQQQVPSPTSEASSSDDFPF